MHPKIKLSKKINNLLSIEYNDNFLKTVKKTLSLAKQLDGDMDKTHQIKVYLALQQNPNKPLEKLEKECEKKTLTSANLWSLIRPAFYVGGIAIAFAITGALLTSLIGSVVSLVAAIACATILIIKKFIQKNSMRQLVKQARDILSHNLPLQERPPVRSIKISGIPYALIAPPTDEALRLQPLALEA